MSHDTHGLPPGGATPPVTRRGLAGVKDHSSDIFFAAIETTRMPMILTDPNQPDNPIVFANQAFLLMTGYSSDEIVGRNCRFLQGAETDRAVVETVRQGIAAREKVTVEILNYRKDGTSFWNALYISPVYTREGELAYFFASQLDVSRRRDAEEALRQAQKMEAVGQLTGGIAHDFNNLLQVILGSLEMFGRGPAGRDARLLHAMTEAAQRAKLLTQQLLAFSRKQTLDGRLVSVNRLIEEMSDLWGQSAGEAVTISQQLDPGLWTARLDPTQAQMALMNIIINARDAMPQGGRIGIRTENVTVGPGDEVMFEGMLPGPYVCIGVSDTGVGIPKAILKRVVEPFFTTKEEGKGTGLGLSMVYGFVKQSGGALRIYSEEGQGTTLRLFFPAVMDQEDARPRAGLRASERGGTEAVLVVDDRLDVAEMGRAMLEDAGYVVEVATDGQAALKALQGRHFDLLFTDIIMPGGMNGVTLARMARAAQPRLRVLLTTGFADTALERGDAGGTEFDTILKPYARTDLVRRVRIVLDGPTGVS